MITNEYQLPVDLLKMRSHLVSLFLQGKLRMMTTPRISLQSVLIGTSYTQDDFVIQMFLNNL